MALTRMPMPSSCSGVYRIQAHLLYNTEGQEHDLPLTAKEEQNVLRVSHCCPERDGNKDGREPVRGGRVGKGISLVLHVLIISCIYYYRLALCSFSSALFIP